MGTWCQEIKSQTLILVEDKLSSNRLSSNGDTRHLQKQASPAHDGKRKRDISLETSLRMYHTF